MNLLAEPTGSRRRLAFLAGAIALVSFALLSIAAQAHATETMYWDNYSASPSSIGYANIDGSGGGALNLPGVVLDETEGMAGDAALGRVYVASELGGAENKGLIAWANVNGSGGGVLSAPGAPVDHPEGLTIDPANQTVYWINTGEETISWAKADGSAGGTLNIAGANFNDPYRLGIDPVAGRVYWGSEDEATREFVISFANVNQTGGGNLLTTGSTPTRETNGLAVDPGTGRVYWLNEDSDTLSYTNTNNTGGGDIASPGASFDEAYGVALDPATGKAYWANYGKSENREGGIGFANYLAATGGGITIASAPFHGAQDPVVFKSPTGSGVPTVTQTAAALACSQGTWSQDYPGGNVFSAPTSYSYQWSLNGAAIAGATAATYSATTAGSYTCTVTGTNVTGSATQGSAPATVTAATLTAKLQTKKVSVKAGKAAVVKIKLANGGDLSSKSVKVCAAKLSKQAKKGLKAPKCASVKALAFGGSAVATLKVKTLKSAKGTYKFTTQVKGEKVKALTVKVKVTAANG